jgi:hypothetical protein
MYNENAQATIKQVIGWNRQWNVILKPLLVNF